MTGISLLAITFATANATTPAQKYGECADTSVTQKYEMKDYNGKRTIWGPKMFCKKETAEFTMTSGHLTVNPDGSGYFTGKAKLVKGGSCVHLNGTSWDVKYTVSATDPKYKKRAGKEPNGYPWQLGIVKDGEIANGSWRVTFDNYPNNNDYGHQVGVGANDKDQDLGGAFWLDFWTKKDGKLQRDGKGDFNFDLKCVPPEDDCPTDGDLGAVGHYNVFVCEDFEGHGSEIRGTAAVGNYMNVSGYGVGVDAKNPKGNILDVGNKLEFHNGQVYNGNARVGYYYNVSNFGIPNGDLKKDANTFDAGDYCDDVCDIAGYLADLNNTDCTVKVEEWGAVSIKAGKSAVCDLDLNKVSNKFADWVWNGWINGITVDAPHGATVVINVSGDKDIWGKTGQFNMQGGVTAHDIIWNFGCDATCPGDLSGVGIKGSLLAPSCKVNFNNGHIDGQYAVYNHYGNGEFHNFVFKGDICIDDSGRNEEPN